MEKDIKYYCEEDGVAITEIKGTKGTLNFYDTQVLIEFAKNIPQNGRYLETGSYLGCSALLVAYFSNEATVWAHDIWVNDWSDLKGDPPPEVKDYFYEFYKAVKKNNFENRIIPIRGDSAYTIGIHDDESFDLIFVDGDHSYEGCFNDITKSWPKLKKGGNMLVHDCVYGSKTLNAVDDFCKFHNIEYYTIQNTYGMVHIKKI
jgi:predicted O-methyltransferase YrrM